MDKLNVYYRALLEYRKQTLNDNGCQKERRAIKKSGIEFDILETSKFLCTIEEDWIVEIEKGLVHIEKALLEERQFIRTNSEVVPIEKVKRISKHSVQDLAQHSEYITRVPENPEDKIIPDKLMMVEKLSDYAVYENRFLYMLLCYLRDFINLRLEKIEKLRRSYSSIFKLKKNIESKNQELTFEMNFSEKRNDNLYPIPDEKTEQLIERIKNCQQLVTSFLKKQLMVDVSKSPMIKPPIVKTNVLKMNNNFKGALTLYEYVSNYLKMGYSSDEVKKEFHPFSEKVADEISEIVTLTSFLSYEYGNNIEELLKLQYLEKQQKQKEDNEKQLLDQIRRMKKRISEEGYSPEEYMLLLEKRNRELENDHDDLRIAKNEILKLEKNIQTLSLEKEELNRQISYLESEIERIKLEHQLEIENLNIAHQNEIALLNELHRQKIEDLKQECENEINNLIENNTQEIANIREEHYKEKEKLKIDIEREYYIKNQDIEDKLKEVEKQNEEFIKNEKEMYYFFETKVNNLKKSLALIEKEKENIIQQCDNKLSNLLDENSKKLDEQKNLFNIQKFSLTENLNRSIMERDLAKAELRTIRLQLGLLDEEDFTSKERFSELEKEFIAFNTFFKLNWKKTKKEIRNEILWKKKEKKYYKELDKKNTVLKNSNENQTSSQLKKTEEVILKQEHLIDEADDNANEEI